MRLKTDDPSLRGTALAHHPPDFGVFLALRHREALVVPLVMPIRFGPDRH